MTPQYICIDEYGNKSYYNDKEMKVRHREDGPAIEWADGDGFWYLNGERLTEAVHASRTAKTVELTMDQIAKLAGVDVSKLKIVKH